MAHDRLKALACYVELHDRIIAGASLRDCARWLQEEKHEFADVKADSLFRALSRYKSDIPPAELNLADGAVTAQRLEDIDGQIDELEMVGKLITIQMGRILRAEGVERTINFNDSKLHNDIEAVRKLIETSTTLKFKLGILKEAERSMTVNHNHTLSKAIDAMSPEDRRRGGVLAQTILTQLALPQGAPGEPLPAHIAAAEEVPFELTFSSPIDYASDPS